MSKLLAYVVFAYWFLLSSFGVPLSAQPLILCGDANRDGEVTLSDVVLALRLAVMLQNPTPWQWDALDFNRDGRIDVGEVRSVLKKVVDPSYNLEGGFRCLGERSEAGIYPIPAPTGSPVPPPPPPSTKQPTPPPAESPPSSISSSVKQTARVIRVIDGDTIEVDIQGRLYRVRYLGIDAPESNQPFGPEATAKNRELVGGKTVLLEKDVSETDRYGRLLRYVWVGNLLVNVELVRLGYAQVVTVPPDVKYHQILLLAQREAQAYQRGLWAPQKPPTGVKYPCDPSYPSVCIPPPELVGDLDCKDIPFRRFPVLPPDPHRFDGDRDGIGCEK